MTKIKFENSPSTNTPINADNLNKLNNVVISSSEPTTGEEVWIQKSNNLLKFNDFTTTTNGITFTMENQILRISGTATSHTQDGYIYIFKTLEDDETLSAEIIGNSTGMIPKAAYSYDETYYYPTMDVVELKEGSYLRELYFIIEGGATVDVTVKIQLEKGKGKSPWQPYIEKKIYAKNDNGIYEDFYKPNLVSITRSNVIKSGRIEVIRSGNIVVVDLSDIILTEDRNEWSTTIATGLPKPFYTSSETWLKGLLIENGGTIQLGYDGDLSISTRTNTQPASQSYNGQLVYMTKD